MGEFVPGLYDQLIDELFGDSADALELQHLRGAVESVDPAEIYDRLACASVYSRCRTAADAMLESMPPIPWTDLATRQALAGGRGDMARLSNEVTPARS